MKNLKIGDTVSWRGAWGTQEAKDAKVEGIFVNCVSKCGDEVSEVDWSEVNDRSVIVDLDNGHWAYGTQISRK